MGGKRTLIYGVGINDADYVTNTTVEGKKIKCPYYRRWTSVLERCYSEKLHTSRPTYIDCSVVDDWLYFSQFKDWMEQQDWEGKDLDKDIIVPNNKVYGPDTCVFVDQRVNTLLTNRGKLRGKYPKGVYYDKRKSKYKSQCAVNGKNGSIGLYTCPISAFKAYVEYKSKLIEKVAAEQVDVRIRDGLLLHAQMLWDEYYIYRDTGEFV